MFKILLILSLIALVTSSIVGCATQATDAEFSAKPIVGYAPLEVQFTDLSKGNITSREWDFNNDGVIDSTDQNPSYTYNAIGNYTVVLKVSGADGNDVEVKKDYIEVIPCPRFADFIAETPVNCQVQGEGLTCVGVTRVQFTDKSKGEVNSWEWDFNNDGIVDSTLQNPIHTYTTNGNYTISLTITTPVCLDTIIRYEYINISGCKT